MNDYDPTGARETSEPARRSKGRRLLSNGKGRWTVAGALMSAVLGLSGCAATSSSSAAPASPSTTATSPSGPAGGGPRSGGGGSNARSGPAAGGSSGTVGSLSGSSFTLSTSAGQKVTVNETSSTTYQKGTNSTSASAVTTGEPVLVLGTTNGTTITATQVILQPAGGSSQGQVVPFQRGTRSTAKQVGQVPTNYNEGSGTIVSGSAANQATEAALAAFSGGVVDRVVQLSNGEYEVHYIGVNWPHHIFINQNFQYVGAD